jgi:hypothetical protein
VEGPSERSLYEVWAPRVLKMRGIVRVHPHQGKGTLPRDLTATPARQKRGLLDQLPATLRGFANSLDSKVDTVVVVVDADDEDPQALAESIRGAAGQVAAGLRVEVGVAIEETEAFYLGDLNGLQRAFPTANMTEARKYKPDSVCGTWELFGRVVGDGGGNKVAWAEAMAPVLTTTPARSRSPSFGDLVKGLRAAAKATPKPKARRKYRHAARVTRGRGK